MHFLQSFFSLNKTTIIFIGNKPPALDVWCSLLGNTITTCFIQIICIPISTCISQRQNSMVRRKLRSLLKLHYRSTNCFYVQLLTDTAVSNFNRLLTFFHSFSKTCHFISIIVILYCQTCIADFFVLILVSWCN